MSVFQCLEKSFTPFSKASIRTSSDLEDFLRTANTTSTKVRVTPDTAMQVPAVIAAISVISQSVAQLPLKFYKREENGNDSVAKDHPLYPILHDQPNDFQSSFDFRQLMQMNVLLYGNAYAIINRVGATMNSRITELIPIEPSKVEVKVGKNMELSYEITLKDGERGKIYDQKDILHLRWLSKDGFRGISPVNQAKEAIGFLIAAERYGAKFFSNNAIPSGVVSLPGKFKTREAAKEWRKNFEDANGGDNQQSTAILENGAEYQTVTMPNDKAQFVELREFQLKELGRVYRLTPHKMQDLGDATFSNVYEMSREFVTDTLMPQTTMWEQAIRRDLLSPTEKKKYFAEHLFDELLKGNTKERYEAYGIAIQNGILNRNEVRAMENRNREDELDEFLQPLNMEGASDGQEAA